MLIFFPKFQSVEYTGTEIIWFLQDKEVEAEKKGGEEEKYENNERTQEMANFTF